ncbi:Scr1 family TA system antitoxin-like transcriptional regulator [Streptomyces sp. NPDC058525]|uniref:Scr1 family TA system antitoxin-like transcriptional regulator n=1 Tax=Streptomyces sp. NPDC058525 TaxID=3346538 RepID=UPI003656A8C5
MPPSLQQQQDRQAQHRLAVLRHADEVTGNVALTCRYYGISRTCCYKWLRRYQDEGLEGLRDRSSKPHHCPHAPEADAEAAARARTARSKILNRRGRTFAFLLEDSVLRPGVADAATTAAQLGHLLEMTALPQVSLGIIPAGAARPLWSMESFTLYDTAQVGIELLSARVTLTAPGETAVYERAFAQLSAVAPLRHRRPSPPDPSANGMRVTARNFPQER